MNVLHLAFMAEILFKEEITIADILFKEKMETLPGFLLSLSSEKESVPMAKHLYNCHHTVILFSNMHTVNLIYSMVCTWQPM